jgi:hypothetical protein
MMSREEKRNWFDAHFRQHPDTPVRRPRDDKPLDPIPRSRAELETRYLTALMKRDARIWAARTGYELGGVIDEPDEEKQEAVNGGNGQRRHLHAATPSGPFQIIRRFGR